MLVQGVGKLKYRSRVTADREAMTSGSGHQYIFASGSHGRYMKRYVLSKDGMMCTGTISWCPELLRLLTFNLSEIGKGLLFEV